MKCPACGIDDPDIVAPQPDADGNYQICIDCGPVADETEDEMERERQEADT